MRTVLEVLHIREAGFYAFPGVGPVMIDRAGYYALTSAELVGPFDSSREARRMASLFTSRPLRPDRSPPPPFTKPTRIVEV